MTKPRYDLALVQGAEIQVGRTVSKRCWESLGGQKEDVLSFILNLVAKLKPEDFAHTQLMPLEVGKPLYGDVYGKLVNGQVWFIKLTFEDGVTTVVMSCHHAHHEPLVLANGRQLRSRR